MSRNAMLGGIAAVVVAAAVAGMGWLLLSGGPPARKPVDTKAPPPKKATASGPSLTPVKRPGSPSTTKPSVAAAASAAPPIDVCARVHELLAEYDALVQPRGAPPEGNEALHQIQTLRERAAKIDRIVDQLASLGEAAVPCLADNLRADARSGRVDRQSLVVRALAKIPGKASLDALGEALVTSDAWGVKMTVVAQLAENGGPEGLAILAQRLEQEQDFRIRGAILKFLGQKKSEAGLIAARRLAQGDENPNVRTQALRALEEMRDQGARGIVEERARMDPDIAVRQNAIQVYGRIAHDQALPFLEDLLQNDPNLRIKAVAILALQDLGGQGVDQARLALERLANDVTASEDVRARATGALAGIDRAGRGTGLPSVGAKLDAVDPTTGEKIAPLSPHGGRR